MRLLVTGSHGYIGTVMVPMLVAEGHEVIGLDSDLYRECTYGDGILDIPYIKKDIRDVKISDLEGFDAVIHLAGLSNDMLGDLNPKLTLQINHAASVRIAKLSKEGGISRFLFSSSCSIYGAAGDKILDEKAEMLPVTPYGISKMMVERDLAGLASEKFSPTFLRNATAYGVSSRMRFDLVLNNLVAWAYTTGRVYLKSDGTPWRPIVHIEDICRAFVAALHSPREVIHNQAFNVGIDQENYRISEIAKIVKEIVRGCRIEYAEGAGPDKRCYRVDFSKYKTTFPRYGLQWDARRGATQIYESYRKFGLNMEEFEGPRYMRVAHIRQLLTNGQLDFSLRWKNEGLRAHVEKKSP